MVIGLESFRKQFEGMENQYAIIGGTACDLLMSEAGTNFRATKDIDIVLIVESLSAEFGSKFWEYVINAGYEHKNKKNGEPQFYRFSHPKSSKYPFMLELFSRKPEALNLPDNAVLTPLPLDEELSSLSAILLDENYYNFIRTGIVKVVGVAILDEVHLIPLKAKAWVDLSEKKAINPDAVDGKDIKKHKNDIYRLSTLLTAETQLSVPTEIYNDMQIFISSINDDATNLKQLGIGELSRTDIIQRLQAAYVKIN